MGKVLDEHFVALYHVDTPRLDVLLGLCPSNGLDLIGLGIRRRKMIFLVALLQEVQADALNLRFLGHQSDKTARMS